MDLGRMKVTRDGYGCDGEQNGHDGEASMVTAQAISQADDRQ